MLSRTMLPAVMITPINSMELIDNIAIGGPSQRRTLSGSGLAIQLLTWKSLRWSGIRCAGCCTTLPQRLRGTAVEAPLFRRESERSPSVRWCGPGLVKAQFDSPLSQLANSV